VIVNVTLFLISTTGGNMVGPGISFIVMAILIAGFKISGAIEKQK